MLQFYLLAINVIKSDMLVDPTVWPEEAVKYSTRLLTLLTISGFMITLSWLNHWLLQGALARFVKFLRFAPNTGDYYLFLNMVRYTEFYEFADRLSEIGWHEGNFYEVFLRIRPLLDPDEEVDFEELLYRSIEELEEEDVELIYEIWEKDTLMVSSLSMDAWNASIADDLSEIWNRRVLEVWEGGEGSALSPNAWAFTANFPPSWAIKYPSHVVETETFSKFDNFWLSKGRNLRLTVPFNPLAYSCYDARSICVFDIYFNDSVTFTTCMERSAQNAIYYKPYVQKTNIKSWARVYYRPKVFFWPQRLRLLRLWRFRAARLLDTPFMTFCSEFLLPEEWFDLAKRWVDWPFYIARWNRHNIKKKPAWRVIGHEIDNWESSRVRQWFADTDWWSRLTRSPRLLWRLYHDREQSPRWTVLDEESYLLAALSDYHDWSGIYSNRYIAYGVARLLKNIRLVDKLSFPYSLLKKFHQTNVGGSWFAEGGLVHYKNVLDAEIKEIVEGRTFLDEVLLSNEEDEIEEGREEFNRCIVSPSHGLWMSTSRFMDQEIHKRMSLAQFPLLTREKVKSFILVEHEASFKTAVEFTNNELFKDRFTTLPEDVPNYVHENFESDLRFTKDYYFDRLKIDKANTRQLWFAGRDLPLIIQYQKKVRQHAWPFFYSLRRLAASWIKQLSYMLNSIFKNNRTSGRGL